MWAMVGACFLGSRNQSKAKRKGQRTAVSAQNKSIIISFNCCSSTAEAYGQIDRVDGSLMSLLYGVELFRQGRM